MSKTEKRILEVHAAEGGEDARLFVADLAAAYVRQFARQRLAVEVTPALNPRLGHQVVTLVIEGGNLSMLDHEAGAHRLQRIPPTERNGRVHTSTVTVAVLACGLETSVSRLYGQRTSNDFRIEWFNGTTKAGGQHHHKNATCCRLTHVASGLVKTAQSRSRAHSQQQAMAALVEELDRRSHDSNSSAVNALRRTQLGDGQRAGVKRRTWRFQEDLVIDHVSGRRARASRVMEGHFDELWR